MKLSGQSILVTGGAGFIGSHLVEALTKNNKVTVYDNFSSSVVLPKDIPKARFIKGDILDEQHLLKALKNTDIVFHLAVACVRLSLSQSRRVHEVNSTGTLTTLLSAVKTGVKLFVYISSSEVYGGTDEINIHEDHPIRPTTVYGMSKYMGEQYSRLFSTSHSIPTIIIRPFNSYGPRSHFEGVYGEVIPRFAIRALSGLSPIIFGNGKQTRDFTYITDTVTGIIQAAESEKIVGKTINIAYGKELSIRKIARIVTSLANISDKPEFKKARPHDIQRLAADIGFAKKIIGYTPKISIEDGLTRYFTWIKKTIPHPRTLLSKIPERNW